MNTYWTFDEIKDLSDFFPSDGNIVAIEKGESLSYRNAKWNIYR